MKIRMDRRYTLGLLPAALVAWAVLLPAHAAEAAQLPRSQPGRHASWVITDLDGDRKTDFASAGASRRVGRDYVQEISLRFSSVEGDTVTVRTRIAGERLTARDLDGDADRDLVLEAFNREPIAVLLNDGDGHFHEAELGKFLFQLSHRSPRTFERVASESDSPDSGECPNDETAAGPMCAWAPVCGGARFIGCEQIARPTSWHPGATSRGPPSLS